MKTMQWILIAALSTGCVGKAKYNEAMAQLQEEQRRASALQAQLQDSQGTQAELMADQAALEGDLARQQRALQMLQQREAEAQARVAAYQDLVARFKSMIDAGQLKVKVVDGRMIVEMNTDILFDSGEATLSADGKTQLQQVAQILASIPDRKYQVEGHTDDVPIKTSRFPSNWELAAARATVAAKAMVDAGLSPDRISAASFAEYRPAAANASKEGRAQNRRIEIVVMPDLSGLPGTEELETVATR